MRFPEGFFSVGFMRASSKSFALLTLGTSCVSSGQSCDNEAYLSFFVASAAAFLLSAGEMLVVHQQHGIFLFCPFTCPYFEKSVK